MWDILRDSDDLEDKSIPLSVDKITFQKVNKLFVDTNTGYLYKFRPVIYNNNPTKSDTLQLNDTIQVHYIKSLINAVVNEINALQKNQMWFIITQ